MANPMNEATVVLCKCGRSKKTFGIRIEKRQGTWWETWAFPISDKSASNEGYDNVQITGNINIDPSYPGCPYCGTSNWVNCGNCNKLTCWDSSKKEAVCECCGNRGTPEYADDFNLSGGGY